MVIRTFFSPVYYKQNLRLDSSENLKQLPIGHQRDGDNRPVCWLDSLMGGGIFLPESIAQRTTNPLLWIVSGPPGTGKTTFVLQLCHLLATHPQPNTQDFFNSFYCSVETGTDALKEHAEKLGWPSNSDLPIHFHDLSRNTDFAMGQTQFLNSVSIPDNPDIVVIDSLNALAQMPNWDAERAIRGLMSRLRGRARILILIQEWNQENAGDPSYAYTADIETRFYREKQDRYLLNRFEIVKMRFQEHARGPQLVKIYGAPRFGATRLLESAPAMDRNDLERKVGGLFILPSVHRHLSSISPFVYNDDARQTNTYLPAPVDNLDAILPGDGSANTVRGIPSGHCTAFIGSRGAMKSHLAYLALLDALKKDSNMVAVMLSMRDDETAAMDTFRRIAMHHDIGAGVVDQFSETSRLHVVYFPPGYLPPEEFMHRVVVAVDGMRARHPAREHMKLILLINGIDHLKARHPLCAAEPMFVTSLLSYLRLKRVTTIVTSALDHDGFDDYGLLQMADLLISFKGPVSVPSSMNDIADQVTELRVLRVPSGNIGGGQGYLYRKGDAGPMQFKVVQRLDS
jgi:KaiC/GvpD/RAD55 family RecA-like ATPase